jgi:hypothetical protein
MSPLRRRLIEDMQIRNLAPSTQRAYVAQLVHFACYFRKSPDLLGPAEIAAGPQQSPPWHAKRRSAVLIDLRGRLADRDHIPAQATRLSHSRVPQDKADTSVVISSRAEVKDSACTPISIVPPSTSARASLASL